MGYYTSLELSVKLKKDIPDHIVDALYFAFWGDNQLEDEQYRLDRFKGIFFGVGDEDIPSIFKAERWYVLLRSKATSVTEKYCSNSVFYFSNENKCFCISINCSLKNYDNEICRFLDFLSPYIDEPLYKIIGRMDNEDVPWWKIYIKNIEYGNIIIGHQPYSGDFFGGFTVDEDFDPRSYEESKRR
jgi:hypothetical protein